MKKTHVAHSPAHIEILLSAVQHTTQALDNRGAQSGAPAGEKQTANSVVRRHCVPSTSQGHILLPAIDLAGSMQHFPAAADSVDRVPHHHSLYLLQSGRECCPSLHSTEVTSSHCRSSLVWPRKQPQSRDLQLSLWTLKLIPQPLHQSSSPDAGLEPAGTLLAPAALIELCRINLWN